MLNLLQQLFPLKIYTDPIQRYRALSTYITASVLLVLGLSGLVIYPPQRMINSLAQYPINSVLLIGTIVLPIGAFITLVLTRTGRQFVGALIVIGVWFGIGWYTLFGVSALEQSIIVVMLGVALASLLVGERAVLLADGVSVLLLYIAAFTNIKIGTDQPFLNITPYALVLIFFASITYSLAHGLPGVIRQMTANNEERRFKLAEASGAITQRLFATRLDLDALLKETVRLVRDTFSDADDVQLFLTDKERRNVTLAASTRTSAPMGQQVGIGSLSVIGRVAITGQSILVRDANEDHPYRRMAFLPGIRSELALPLRVGTDTIGVLDVQSANATAFDADDTRALETLVNQIAIAVDNARLYADAQMQVAENKRLFEQTKASLREIERLNQQLTGGAWAEYLRAQPATPAFTLDLNSGQVENVADWTPTLVEASRRNEIMIKQTPTAKIVALPISVRGQSIGAMEFELAPEQEISQEQMLVLRQVVERLGLAAENTRLFEEAQRIAQREALVNEISSRMQVTTNVEAVVAAATQSLADAFQAPRVAIRLGAPDPANGHEHQRS